MEKAYFTFTGQSKYAAKWWLGYTDEQGEYHTKAFPTSSERAVFINKLESHGYTCDYNRCR